MSPRGHLAASLRLFDALAEAAGGARRYPGAEAWRELLDRPRALPAALSADGDGLKLDGYLTRSDDGPAWGFACNQRWEGRAFWRVAEELGRHLGRDLEEARALREEFSTAAVTVSVGFDRPGAAPRLKVYLQEEPQGAGVCTVDALRARGWRVPAPIGDDVAVGVVALDLREEGTRRKIYLGAPSAGGAAARVEGVGAADLQALVAALHSTTHHAAWCYATVRLGDQPTVALNPIYDVRRVPAEAAWEDVRRLFGAAGREGGWHDLGALRAALPGLRLVPTATAIERAAGSADAYIAAWPR